MVKAGTIAARLHDALSSRSIGSEITDVRIGLGYVGVRLDSAKVGIAAVLRNELPPGCTTIHRAGTLTGRRALELLTYLVTGRTALDRAIGLATANALIEKSTENEKDTLKLLCLSDRDHVAMVGMFRPLIKKIRSTGAELSIIERDPAQMNVAGEEAKKNILQKCTVAIITATAIVTNTMEEILASLGCPRHVVVLGPSTPMCSAVFEDTAVTHLGGSVVMDGDKILQVISEGGGTPAMRPHLKFVTILTAQGTRGIR
ncbi:MAG: DUF364 domain-containing protein [Deltaproteobacteria bacterium]|nr:DUF364 domain-containing protein [Deltaproteobacteria bacterium]MBN2688302.1 DUF364 domain-containing protein [Deltaproteobacteria bacterium]